MFHKEKLAEFMKKEGMTQAELAKRFGISEGAVRHIIVGIKQPSLAMTCDIAELMGCTVDELIVKE